MAIAANPRRSTGGRAPPYTAAAWSTPSAAGNRSPSAWRRSCCWSTRTRSRSPTRQRAAPAARRRRQARRLRGRGRDRLADLPRRARGGRGARRRPRAAARGGRDADRLRDPPRRAVRRGAARPGERYEAIADSMRGFIRRTPTCALHVHVGMPDPETAIRACRGCAPTCRAAGAGRALAVLARAGLRLRERPRAALPRLPARRDPARVRRLGGLRGLRRGVARGRRRARLHVLWWDIRPHPRLGTVEVRAMDAQARLGSVAGLAALVHGLALAVLDGRADPPVPGAEITRARSAPAATGSTRPALGRRDAPAAGAAAEAIGLARGRCASAAPAARSSRPSGSCAGQRRRAMRAAHERRMRAVLGGWSPTRLRRLGAGAGAIGESSTTTATTPGRQRDHLRRLPLWETPSASELLSACSPCRQQRPRAW